MSRRWKVGIALAVVGIAGWLGWMVLIDTKPVLTLRFIGYETNTYGRGTGVSAVPSQIIYAVFVMSNGTSRPIICHSNSGTATWHATRVARDEALYSSTSPAGVLVQGNPSAVQLDIMEPATSGKIYCLVRDFNQPIHSWVAYQNVPRSHPLWDRLPPRWRWPNSVRSVDVTIQER